MKRLHVHLSVDDLDRSIAFYTAMFGAAPGKVRDDYARWMLDDPRVNFALSRAAGGPAGLSHLGVQADSEAELAELEGRIDAAGAPHDPSAHTHCCYAETKQGWATDPEGIRWEAFHTYGDSDTFREVASECCGGAGTEDGSRCCV